MAQGQFICHEHAERFIDHPPQDIVLIETLELRQHCLGHLTNVVMVSADSLAAERLGGADYDGDLIKTILERSKQALHCAGMV